MTTDTTELAQRARINADCGEHLSPAETIELVEALEKAQHEAAVDWEAAASLNVENQELKRRIAGLEASHAKLRDAMAAIHNTIRTDGAYTPLAAILNAAKRAHEESASATGIKWEGE